MNFFWGGGAENPWRNKAEKFAGKIHHKNSQRNSPAVFLKIARPKPKIQTKSALQNLWINRFSIDFLHFQSVSIRFHQKFRKGVGGQRGLARGSPSKARDSGLFSVPFFLCPLSLGEGGQISGELFGLFLGVCLSPTPSRQPLFETSDSINFNQFQSV